MGVSITRIVKFIRKGDKGDKGDPGQPGTDGNDGVDAITIDISQENILHKKATTKSTYKVNIKVYRGE